MLIFNGKIKKKRINSRVSIKEMLSSLFYETYRDMLFPLVVILLCVLGTFLMSKTIEARNVFGEWDEKYIAIIIDDFGYDGEGTEEMLKLGIPVTAAVMPGMSSSGDDVKKYHEAGCDIILHQPMEPHKGVGPWLGPYGLTSGLSDDEVYKSVKEALDSIEFAVGINNHMGSKIMENERIISQVIKLTGERSLIFVDSKTTGKSVAPKLAQNEGIRFYERDVFLDTVKSVEHTKKQLLMAAEIADKKGYAIVIGHVGSAGGRTTVQGIKEALPGLLEKGYKFVTISDLDMRLNMGALID